jgi:hypothetical protein
MVTSIDLLYVALFALAWPLFDYYFFWPRFLRRVHVAPAQSRAWLWWTSIVTQWWLVAIGVALWMYFARPWSALMFTIPEGWRLAVAIVLVVAFSAYQVYCIVQLRRDPALRERVRATLGDVADVVPHTRAETRPFTAVSMTAGFCEEFLYRGYFVWTFAPWLGWWGAAALSLLFFAAGHAYQGWRGVVKTALAGACFTVIVALLDSLWPAIVLHVLVDAFAGFIAWIVLRDEQGLE